jgi:DNA-binding Lrp family transcriptional regulator
MRAYIQVTAGLGKARDVARKVQTLAGIKMANACYGDPDVFVVAEVPSSDDLNKLILEKIQTIEGIAGTSTHIAID